MVVAANAADPEEAKKLREELEKDESARQAIGTLRARCNELGLGPDAAAWKPVEFPEADVAQLVTEFIAAVPAGWDADGKAPLAGEQLRNGLRERMGRWTGEHRFCPWSV